MNTHPSSFAAAPPATASDDVDARKHIVFVTGTRADFGKLEPLALAARDGGFRVSFFVTGMHMMQRYGLTKAEPHRVPGTQVYEFLNQRAGDPQDVVLAKTVIGFSDFIDEMKPDLVIVHGDRVEAMACALVCATNYVRCAHVEGGEVSGTIDEIFRHCNTKLAGVHFVSSAVAAERVARLGEDPASIHVIGSPELDKHGQPSGVTLGEVKERYQIGFEEYGIVVFHPVTSERDTIGEQAAQLFGALERSRRSFVVIQPNNDPGSEKILEVIQRMPKDRFRALPSMRFLHFSELMKNGAVVVGNSSLGVREAPFLGVPSLDIGSRQTNRALSSSISSCPADAVDAISTFLSEQWGRRYPPCDGFGRGGAAQLFVEVLRQKAFWNQPLQKTFHGAAGATPHAAYA
jgi:UDP-N-acetylglucosamine 2-epimerase (hydrolysing)